MKTHNPLLSRSDIVYLHDHSDDLYKNAKDSWIKAVPTKQNFSLQLIYIYRSLAHVFFDDAFYHDENQQRTLNMFVKDFFEAINKAAG